MLPQLFVRIHIIGVSATHVTFRIYAGRLDNPEARLPMCGDLSVELQGAEDVVERLDPQRVTVRKSVAVQKDVPDWILVYAEVAQPE